MNRFISTVAVLAVTPASLAQIVVDGTADKAYGNALAVQNVQTQFGDSNSGQIDVANGSEINGLFARVEGGVLYMVIAGNLESNFNKLEVFLDTSEGGQNRLRGDNPNVDNNNGLNRMGDDGTGNGLTFDECFTANFFVTTTCGGTPFSTYANIAQVLTDGGGIGAYIGSGGAGTNIIDDTKYGVKVGYNNSNTAGVVGGTGDAGTTGSGVRTGVEIALPLSLIGVDPVSPQNIKVCAFVNGGGHDFASNQFIGGLGAGYANLAEPRAINLAAIPGNQYVVVELVPGQPDCPSTNDCPADLNDDGSVGGADLTSLLAAWGSPDADLDGDGTTAGTDLTTLLAAWGECP